MSQSLILSVLQSCSLNHNFHVLNIVTFLPQQPWTINCFWNVTFQAWGMYVLYICGTIKWCLNHNLDNWGQRSLYIWAYSSVKCVHTVALLPHWIIHQGAQGWNSHMESSKNTAWPWQTATIYKNNQWTDLWMCWSKLQGSALGNINDGRKTIH